MILILQIWKEGRMNWCCGVVVLWCEQQQNAHAPALTTRASCTAGVPDAPHACVFDQPPADGTGALCADASCAGLPFPAAPSAGVVTMRKAAISTVTGSHNTTSATPRTSWEGAARTAHTAHTHETLWSSAQKQVHTRPWQFSHSNGKPLRRCCSKGLGPQHRRDPMWRQATSTRRTRQA